MEFWTQSAETGNTDVSGLIDSPRAQRAESGGSCASGSACDTGLLYLDPTDRGKKRPAAKGHLWCFVGQASLVGFRFARTWEADEIATHLTLAARFVQGDGYAGYGSEVAVGAEFRSVATGTSSPRPATTLQAAVARTTPIACNSQERSRFDRMHSRHPIFEESDPSQHLRAVSHGQHPLGEARSVTV